LGKTILISSDTTCDLPKDIVERYGISQIPLYISFGDESYLDSIEITPDEVYKRYRESGVLPKTAAVSIGDFIEYFKGLLTEAENVIHFSLSSALSCTYQNATIAAEEFGGRVHVIDSMNLSTGEGMSILYAAELAEAGTDCEEIVRLVQDYIPRIEGGFVVDSLEFLRKGGRCSALASLGANLLSIKPSILVRDGKMDVGKKYRGKFKAVLGKYFEEILADGPYDSHRAIVTHAGCDPEIVDFAYNLVKESGLFEEVLLTRAGCTISSHCGPDTLGAFVIRK